MQSLPMELADVSPGDGFTKMELGTRPDGLPDGVHTGGPWLSPDGNEVWKPLDARPHQGATERCPTEEAECLEAMAGKPGFPHNWRVETQNGRRWLVRPFCYLWPQDSDKLIKPKLDVFLMAEDAIRELNKAGWTYNDMPQLAYDPIIHEWFLLDCSAAHKAAKWHDGDGDWYRFPKWFEYMGLEHIKRLRERGYHVWHCIMLPEFNDKTQEPYDVLSVFYDLGKDARRQHVYLYASTLRPLGSWCNIPGARFLRGDTSKSPRVHSWVAADHLLDQETVDKFELSFAYRPWP